MFSATMDHQRQMEMDGEPKKLSVRTKPSNSPKLYRFMNGGPQKSSPSIWFEIRLFYVRIAPCVIDAVPNHLTLRLLRDFELGGSLEINGSRIPASDTASSTLRRDRVDRDSSEVTYVSTDNVRISGGFEFEVYEDDDDNDDKEKKKMLLCGSLERMESDWSMDCYTASVAGGSSAFFQPKLGISSTSLEVYVAGRCSDVPVILTKTINISPRRKPPRHCTLDAIPEVDEIDKENKFGDGLIRQGKLQLTETEINEYDTDGKIAHSWYPEDIYDGEDGQLSWFNAGVRVGVGIGMGMCLGIGIGVGLLMRSYQTTTRNFRRKFF